MKALPGIVALCILLVFCGCSTADRGTAAPQTSSAFDEDVAFLKNFTQVVVLTDRGQNARVVVLPALQGRVMTTTTGNGESFGWINRKLFESGDTSVHMNAFGGEERFWLGPEGGQFSIFFERGKEFNLENWKTPKLIDLEPFDLVTQTAGSATFRKSAEIVNYAGTRFRLMIDRTIEVLESAEAFAALNVPTDTSLQVVAFRSVNSIENAGDSAWSKKSGLLSIWLLGMFKPAPRMTVFIPFIAGGESELGRVVIDDYFGKVPSDRLKITDSMIYFKGDG
ncbi:MAG TPA: DUF6786 family protein, partial [Chryseosolibacter sp.]|nr:DUF6786 family protein [Chryseosolibacter sp.]